MLTNSKISNKNNIKKYDNIDYNKELNSKCICGTGLPWKNDNIIMLYPCEHMLHKTCKDKNVNNINGISVCPICDTKIERIFNMFDEDLHSQRFADMLSMSYYDDMSNNTPLGFLDSIFDLATVFAKMAFMKNPEDGKMFCEKIFSLNNITLKVYGLDKIKQEKNKVYICNHVAHIELIILYYLLGSGFLASNIVGGSKIVEHLQKIVPLLTFERGTTEGVKKNVVEEMKKYVAEKGSICLFPEGLMKHPDTLTRFRTGAFNVGFPVYAITIRHNDIICDGYLNGFLYKLSGKKNVTMEVHVLGPYYPPFNEESIEKIRLNMASVGNMVLSRVSNRDISDAKMKTGV